MTCRYSTSPPARQICSARDSGTGSARDARGDLGDQAVLPVLALQLPGAEPDQHGEAGDAEHRRPDQARSFQALPHRCAQSSANRPCSALCLNCRAISVALRTRSRKNASSGREHAPQHDVHPHRRMQLELDEERAAEHEEAQDEDGEYGRAVAGVGEGIAEPAALALLAQHQPAAEQRALAAARAAPLEAGGEHGGIGCVLGHVCPFALNAPLSTLAQGRPCPRSWSANRRHARTKASRSRAASGIATPSTGKSWRRLAAIRSAKRLMPLRVNSSNETQSPSASDRA